MDYTPSNRERVQESERDRMPKHGANTGTLYANAIKKRQLAAKVKRQRLNKRAESYEVGE